MDRSYYVALAEQTRQAFLSRKADPNGLADLLKKHLTVVQAEHAAMQKELDNVSTINNATNGGTDPVKDR